MTRSPADYRAELEARLRRIGGQPDADMDLAEAALLLAALDRPGLPLKRYRDHVGLLQTGRAQQALEVIGTVLMIAPRAASLWHEAGALHARLGNLRAAAQSLEQFLDLGAGPESLHEAATLLQQVKSRLN